MRGLPVDMFQSMTPEGSVPAYLKAALLRKNALQQELMCWGERVKNRHLVLEFGSGHGHFLTQYALAYPEKEFLGIDIMGGRLERALRKASLLGLHNIQFLKAEASELLELWPQNHRLNEIFMLFPDPWPKRKHHKNRMIQLDFLDALAAIVEGRGRFYFRTDDLNLAEWTREHFEKNPQWQLCSDDVWPFNHPTIFQLKADQYFSIVAEKI